MLWAGCVLVQVGAVCVEASPFEKTMEKFREVAQLTASRVATFAELNRKLRFGATSQYYQTAGYMRLLQARAVGRSRRVVVAGKVSLGVQTPRVLRERRGLG